MTEDPDQQNKDEELYEKLINLRRMQSHAEWRSRPLRQRICKRDSPRQSRRFPKTTSCRKTSKAADGVADGNARCEGIRSLQLRQMMTNSVPVANCNREQQTTREDAAGLQRIKDKEIQRLIRMHWPGREEIQ